jgi:hypothetical protein
MGKGSGSGSNTATKQARSSSTGAEGGGGQEAQSTNSCLFAFTEHFTFSAGTPVKVGDIVALVPDASNTGQLDIIIGSGRYGHYAGQHRVKLNKQV